MLVGGVGASGGFACGGYKVQGQGRGPETPEGWEGGLLPACTCSEVVWRDVDEILNLWCHHFVSSSVLLFSDT